MGQYVMRLQMLIASGFVLLTAGCAAQENPAPEMPGPGTGTKSVSGPGATGNVGGANNAPMPPMNAEQKAHSNAMTQGYSKAYAEAASARQQQTRR